MTKDEDIEFCRAERDAARRRLKSIKAGERHLRGPANGPYTDVTDKHRAVLETQENYWTKRLSLLGVNDDADGEQ